MIHCAKMVKYVKPFCFVYAALMTVSSNLEQGLQSSMGNIEYILESPQEL